MSEKHSTAITVWRQSEPSPEEQQPWADYALRFGDVTQWRHEVPIGITFKVMASHPGDIHLDVLDYMFRSRRAGQRETPELIAIPASAESTTEMMRQVQALKSQVISLYRELHSARTNEEYFRTANSTQLLHIGELS